MKTFSKRLLTILLAAAMVFGLSGLTTFAAEVEDDTSQDVSAEPDMLSEEEDVVETLAYDGEYPDIVVYKNGFRLQTITGEEFKAAEEKAPYVMFEMRRGSTDTYTEVWANFVLVSDLLDEGVAPDPDCGALMESTPWASMEDLYIYMTEDGTYRMAVDGASGSTGWYNGVTTITLGHDFDANGDCRICGHSRLDYIDYNVRYAVCLWGIEQNEDRYGNKLGLTFGPATGADYTNTYNAHLTQGQYESGEFGICLHWMTWEEIIEQSETDPGAFEECFENGCTHSVNLKLNSTLMRTSYEDKMNSGDGAGVLYDSIASTYREFNSSNRNDGGWPASQMRATLNGKDRKTGDNADNALDAGNCLLSCFPTELRASIVPTAVASDTVWDSQEEGDCKTTYDKLWIPSGKEVYADAGSNNALIRPNEGELSQRSIARGITTTENREVLSNYAETGATQSWRLRSMGTTSAQSNYFYQVESDGSWYRGAATATTIGIAPCFCLRGTQNETNDSYYDVKYAVSIWGINQDIDEEGDILGLTFGPATGKSYIDDYEAHLPEEEYDPQNGKYCLHWMTWDEIITQSVIDPTVFEECMEYGCTHAVNLTMNDEIIGSSYADEMDDGDGAGILYNSIAYQYLRWNDYNAFTSGGWAASKNRAMLNGQDALLSRDNGDTLDEDHCLLSCFPEVLQEAIVPKEVKSATVFGGGEDDIVTTYDPLWLFATVEAWGEGAQADRNAYLNPAEGTLSGRSSAMGITLSQYSALASFDEEGGTHQTWTRSLYGEDNVAVMEPAGSMQFYYINSALASAPCFCLGDSGNAGSNKTALRAEYDADKELVETDYTEESWTPFAEALKAAKDVLDDIDATQDDVDEALATLQSAKAGLVAIPVDKKELEKEIEAANDLNKDDYTSESWAPFAEALKAATDVLDDADATQEDVDEALAALQSAKAGLVEIPADKEELEKEIDSAKDLNKDDYTAESWEALAEALAAAQEVAQDPNATAETVEAAVEALKTAIENLEPAKNTEPEPTPTPTPEPTPTPGDTYTGFVKGTGGHDYYMENGEITGKKQGILKDKDNALGDTGAWYYVIDSEVQYGFTGLSNFSNENGWWYIVKGKVDFTHNGVDKNKNGWWYVTGGKVQFGFTGLANYKNANGWWYIVKGKVDFNHNGVDKNKNGWWYVTGGKVQFGFTGLANYRNANGWWYIRSGKVDFGFTGIASNVNGNWYVRGGKVQFGYSGTVNYYGKAYTVRNGMVI